MADQTTSSSVIVDADPWLRRARLPYWGLAQIRQLKVGEGIDLVHYQAPLFSGREGVVSVSIERERGKYRMHVVWLSSIEKNRAKPRGHIWWEFAFKLLPGRKFELIPERDSAIPESLKRGLDVAALVLRRSDVLAEAAKRDGDKAAARALRPRCYLGAENRSQDALNWLAQNYSRAAVA